MVVDHWYGFHMDEIAVSNRQPKPQNTALGPG